MGGELFRMLLCNRALLARSLLQHRLRLPARIGDWEVGFGIEELWEGLAWMEMSLGSSMTTHKGRVDVAIPLAELTSWSSVVFISRAGASR